jgi:hypothetical protein
MRLIMDLNLNNLAATVLAARHTDLMGLYSLVATGTYSNSDCLKGMMATPLTFG